MTTKLSDEQIQHLLHGIAIPPQPQVMVDLQMEQFSPSCSVSSIAHLISQDVGLSGAILKTVNSPYFNLSNEISSIIQAVNLLGVDSVVNLVNAQSIRGALSDADIIALGAFWDNAMDVAMAAAAIAKQIGFPTPDEAYTLGLFHDCGIALLMERFENYTSILHEAYSREDACILDTENQLINTNHAVVGYYVGKSWNLPLFMCEAIHEHHKVEKLFENEQIDPKKKTLLAILKMAEHICGTYRHYSDQSVDHEWQRIAEMILLYVGLSTYDFEAMAENLSEIGLGNNISL